MALVDDLNGREYSSSGETNPAGYAEEINPADVDLPAATRSIYVGGDGNLRVKMAGNGDVIIHTNVLAGMYYPIRASQIMSGTTATGIVAWY